MIKVITLLKRKPGLLLDEFYKYWLKQHSKLAVKDHPEVIKYIQNHGLILLEGDQEYDGIAETYWPDMGTFQKAVDEMQTTEKGQNHIADLDKFVDLSKMVSIVTEEKIIKQ